MNRNWVLASVLFVGILATGCGPEPGSSAGLWLPEGDPEAGQIAFVSLQCNACHTIQGVGMAPPVADPRVGVDLAVVSRRSSEAEIITSIIHPDHEIATRFASGRVDTGGHSRMGDYTDVMTVRQLVDVVAFLREAHTEGDSR